MSTAIKVPGICGSLRQVSYSAAALRAAQELAPAAGAMIESADISALPLYNEDLRVKGFPVPAERLREQIRSADALRFVTPEYNCSIPGVLKNVNDSASRPPDQPFAGKPAAVMGASMSLFCSARVKERLLAGEHEELMAYETLGPNARLALPTPEHYLPLRYVIALQEQGEAISFFNSTVLSSISMTSMLIWDVSAT